MTAAGAESPVASLPILIGYDLRRVLGEDTTGIYLEAVQESLDRTVTVKLSRRSSGDATDLARFEEEIYLCTRAKHPGLLNAIDSGEVDGRLFLVTESIRVRTLATELAEQGPVEEKRAAGLALDIAGALTYLEQKKLVYRNLQPAYVLFPGAAPRLLTYRQVRRASEAEQLRKQKSQSAAYCAPELVTAELGEAGIQANVYALGGLLHHMLTGSAPLEGPHASVRTAHAHGLVPPVRSRRPGVAEKAERVVTRLMTPDPTERPTPKEAAVLLQDFLNNPLAQQPLRSTRRRRRRR